MNILIITKQVEVCTLWKQYAAAYERTWTRSLIPIQWH